MFECVVLLILLQEGSLSGQSDETADEGVQGVLNARKLNSIAALTETVFGSGRLVEWRVVVPKTFSTSPPCMRPVVTLVFLASYLGILQTRNGRGLLLRAPWKAVSFSTRSSDW